MARRPTRLKVDEMLRRRIRRHGDMSLSVQRSLDEIDLRLVEIGRFHGKKVLSTTKATQVVMPVSLRKKLQEIAPERGCSMNELPPDPKPTDRRSSVQNRL